MRLRSTRVVLCAAMLVACGGTAARPAPELAAPLPVPDSVAAIRGTAEAAGALKDEDQLQIVSAVLRNFYYPEESKARWFDPRPLAHLRSAAEDDTVGADPDFADEVVLAARATRICVLNYRDFGCRGKTGSVLRFSWPYRVGKDSAVVFVTTSPRDSAGGIGAVQSETKYRLRWNRDGYWDMARGTKIVSPKADSAKQGSRLPPSSRP